VTEKREGAAALGGVPLRTALGDLEKTQRKANMVWRQKKGVRQKRGGGNPRMRGGCRAKAADLKTAPPWTEKKENPFRGKGDEGENLAMAVRNGLR